MVDNHFKDVESVRCGQLFHVPSQPALFPLPREPRGLPSRDKNLQPIFLGCGWYFRGNVFGWSTCEYFDNLFRYAQFKGFLCYGKYSGANSANSVLGCTIRLWTVATLNMHDNWLRMLQDDELPKSSWRPRKSTKSWDQLKIHESPTVTEKGPSRGKIGPTEPRGVEGMYQNSRCASREKTWVQSTKKLKRSVSQRRIEREF